MLQLGFIRENKQTVIDGLKKRNFKETEIVYQVIELDEKRNLPKPSWILFWRNPTPFQKKSAYCSN